MKNTNKQLVALGLMVAFGLLPIAALAKVPETGNSAARETMKNDRIKLLGEKAVSRLTAALDRADNFRQRVALHASQFPSPRFDKATVDQKLAEATDAIAKGRLAVAAIQTAMDSALAATNTTGSFTDVRAKIREAMVAIRAAHQKIVDAIVLIKAGYKPLEQATTTTP